MNTYAKRLIHAIKLRNTSQSELARAVGVKPQSIQYLCKEGTKSTHSVKIAEILKINPQWLTDGIGLIEINTSISDIKSGYHANVEEGPEIMGRVPLISWVQAGEWAEIIDNFLPGDAEEWRLTTARVSKNAFSLRVKGDSMTNPHGAPSIPEGCVVVIDPNVQYNNKSIVVARLEDSMEATLKMLIIDGNQKFLKPLNPIYPLIPINGNCHIVGTAVRVEFDL